MAATSWNSNSVSISFAGISIENSREMDNFLTIEPIQPERHTMEVGADGEVGYSQSNDNRHKATIRLMQKSDGNAVLSAILNGDLKTEAGAGIGPFAAMDMNGTSICVEPEARIQGWPTKEYGEKADKTQEWVILLPNPERFDGSH